ncbi:hypothetical protein BS50DRAFT_569350 [Corynespora cassiicola Philippines]|uniref:DJ-1/PfpI domain-containing protein n=1 Tax=Corynespora cassiicola Philippines TaxID=1448308 RepID=A0A2T2P1Z8_CORCC|nr:hypothetical protein BS50DRAFT_569350 [Corynespora cassiicola Philippines]
MSFSVSEIKPLRVGVLYEETQMSDLSGCDVIGNLSKKTIEIFATMGPGLESFKPLAIPAIEWLYISSSFEPARTTPEMYVRPTHTYENAPRDLDIIMIGGPDPSNVPEASIQFLKEASEKTKAILTTCTGGMWLAKSGILDGKKATTNRMGLPLAKMMFPNVDWADQRWVIEDGKFEGAKIWTAGGAGCGES